MNATGELGTVQLLLNSAADGKCDLRPDEFTTVSLKPGNYLVEFAFIEAEYVGCFTRLTYRGPAAPAERQ